MAFPEEAADDGQIEITQEAEGFSPRLAGRDHHPHGFTVWLAGAGIKGGTVYGSTDELGFHAEPGRKRLEIDYGKPIDEILT